MQLGKQPRRIIAATFLVILLTNLAAPAVSYALTSGPTAPESTSFEPVDTTDMVNLQTGDFTYNIPLLEVPGPEGGYPLSLSYHAGIQPNEDASWVGLGWSLNPGAINRNVNSYPDDWHDVSQVVRDYWSGGETKTFGFNLGLAMGPANASIGLSFSNDTYRGFGAGFDVSIGFGLSPEIGLNLGMGVSPYGEDLTVSAGLSLNGGPVSGSLGISTDFKSTEFSGGLSVASIGISLSSSGSVTFKAAGAGVTKAFGPNAGKIQSKSRSFFLPLLGLSSPFSWSYTRYWSDETANIKTHGALYMYPAEDVWESNYWASGFPYHAYDVYHLPDDPVYSNIVEDPDARKVPGGSFPDNDNYQVVGQGLSGSFRPYAFQEKLYNQSVYGDEPQRVQYNQFFASQNAGSSVVASYPKGHANSPQAQVNFRFVDDFSNSYRQDKPGFTEELSTYKYNFDNDHLPGTKYGIARYQQTQNKLAGSKHIEYFTNRQINSVSQEAKNAGFINVDATSGKGFARNTDDMIGGFSITNESGVTYHYALPAYAYDEVVYTENMPSERAANGYIWNKVSKPGRYAYTWHLTGITGPDFVDKDNNGLANDGDWGYWVSFEYGKWIDNYGWRNPSEGFHRDLDTKFQNYSKGKKELYYLNAIRTRTHVAIFEKDVRIDGKGTSSASMNINNHNGAASFIFDNTVYSPMQLSKVFLVPKEELANIPLSLDYNHGFYFHMNENVYDKPDIDAVRTSLVNSSIKIIEFNYDNSLCPGTADSYAYTDVNVKEGKLTLNSLQVRGKRGALLIPPTLFNYDLASNELRSSSVVFSNYDANKNTSDIQTTVSDAFQEGDILKFNTGSGNDYCTVLQKNNATSYKVIFIRNHTRSYNGVNVTASTTKNPFYAAEYTDNWGMFKSDFDPKLKEVNENLSKLTSTVSSKAMDVWSLRSVRTALGATLKVNYEPDSYRKSVLNDYISLILQQQGAANLGTMEITFNVLNEQNVQLSNYLTVGQDVTSLLVAHEFYKGSTLSSTKWTPMQTTPSGYSPIRTVYKYTVVSLVGNTLKLHLDLQPYANPITPMYDMLVIANMRLKETKDFTFLGGGLRVGSIELNNALDEISKRSSYDYKALSPFLTSGVTSFQPQVFDAYDAGAYRNGNFEEYMKPEYDKVFRKALYRYVDYMLAISRELPPPGVIYEYVGVKNEVKHPGESYQAPEGRVVYQHECFNENMIGVVENTPRDKITNVGPLQVTHYNRNMSVKVFTSRVGLLKRVIQLDDNNRKLSEVINSYLHDDIQGSSFSAFQSAYDQKLAPYEYQGVVEERFSNGRVVWKNVNPSTQAPNYVMSYLNVMSGREEYPVVQTGQKTINYVDVTTIEKENKEFDFFTGAVTKSVQADAYGNRFLTEIEPAYRSYTAMGLKLGAPGNKHMLSQVAAEYLYKVDASNTKTGLVSAIVNTYGNATQVIDESGNKFVQNVANNSQGDVWRLQNTFKWLPETKSTDGITPVGSFVSFNRSSPAASDQRWKKTLEVSLYDVYSKALEAKDANGNFAAARMGYGNKKVIMSAQNAKLAEIAFSGAEDAAIDQTSNYFIRKLDGVINSVPGFVHTGKQSLKLPAGKKGFLYTVSAGDLTPGRDYYSYVWLHQSEKPGGNFPSVRLYYEVNGTLKNVSTANTTRVAGNWMLLSLQIQASHILAGSTLTVGCRNDDNLDVYVDDMRFQPVNSTSTAFVFDPFSGELTHVLNNNNLFSKYEYDGAGRLVKTYNEKIGVGEYKTNEYFYNYALSSIGLIGNEEKNQPFVRNNCPFGFLGSQVIYKVDQGKYLSYTSLQDANNQAQVDINANGQKYANIAGDCVVAFYNKEVFRLVTKTTCDNGYYSIPIQYLVSYAKHASVISQADADAKAQADMDLNAQEFAELNGPCFPNGAIFGKLELENVTTNGSGEEFADLVAYFYNDYYLTTPTTLPMTTVFVEEEVRNTSTNVLITNQYITPSGTPSGQRIVLWSQMRLKGVENGVPIQRKVRLANGYSYYSRDLPIQ